MGYTYNKQPPWSWLFFLTKQLLYWTPGPNCTLYCVRETSKPTAISIPFVGKKVLFAGLTIDDVGKDDVKGTLTHSEKPWRIEWKRIEN